MLRGPVAMGCLCQRLRLALVVAVQPAALARAWLPITTSTQELSRQCARPGTLERGIMENDGSRDPSKTMADQTLAFSLLDQLVRVPWLRQRRVVTGGA